MDDSRGTSKPSFREAYDVVVGQNWRTPRAGRFELPSHLSELMLNEAFKTPHKTVDTKARSVTLAGGQAVADLVDGVRALEAELPGGKLVEGTEHIDEQYTPFTLHTSHVTGSGKTECTLFLDQVDVALARVRPLSPEALALTAISAKLGEQIQDVGRGR